MNKYYIQLVAGNSFIDREITAYNTEETDTRISFYTKKGDLVASYPTHLIIIEKIEKL